MLNEQRQPIFGGSPGILETFDIDAQQERIFNAVVKPERLRRDLASLETERARLEAELQRAEKMLANEKFVANAAPEVVEGERRKLEQYRAELDALGG